MVASEGPPIRPRWKPNPDEENRLYRKIDEGVQAGDLIFRAAIHCRCPVSFTVRAPS